MVWTQHKPENRPEFFLFFPEPYPVPMSSRIQEQGSIRLLGISIEENGTLEVFQLLKFPSVLRAPCSVLRVSINIWTCCGAIHIQCKPNQQPHFRHYPLTCRKIRRPRRPLHSPFPLYRIFVYPQCHFVRVEWADFHPEVRLRRRHLPLNYQKFLVLLITICDSSINNKCEVYAYKDIKVEKRV